MRDPRRKVVSLATARQWREAVRNVKGTLAVTNGCFDVFHAGHAEALQAARNEADALLVLVNGDASVRALKGQERPIHTVADRALVVASLSAVDSVVVFEGTDCAGELRELRPDVYVKSEEYRDCQHPAEKAALEACGARVVWLRRRPELSTSKLLEKLGA